MSSSRSNGLTKDYSGKFGDQYVLRRKNGKSLMTKLPEKTKRPPSEGQQRVIANFRAASAFAREKLSDPAIREAYLKKGNGVRSAYNVAMADFFNPPVINLINTGFYKGNAGNVILVEAIDDFRVERVILTLSDANGNVLESGDCTHTGDGPEWVYTLMQDQLPVTGQSIRAVAFDLPNHPGEGVCNL